MEQTLYKLKVKIYLVNDPTKSVSDKQYNKYLAPLLLKREKEYLAPLAIFHYREKTLYDIIDRDLWKQMDPQSFSIFAETAYDCLNEERSRRPDIGEVVTRLEKALELHIATCKQGLDMDEPEVSDTLNRFRVIKSATNKFDDAHCTRKGGFGKVYKGELVHLKGRSVVALKRLDRAFGQGDPEFWKEIIMLSLYRHDNIVSLLGFCDDCGEKILAYEYASKRSLDLYLNDKDLTWVQRLEICIGAARGLAYFIYPCVRSDKESCIAIIKSSISLFRRKLGMQGLAVLGLSPKVFRPQNQKIHFSCLQCCRNNQLL
ncbi:protein kinase, ATP binding site-containing protein [Tanacetum coccineum]